MINNTLSTDRSEPTRRDFLVTTGAAGAGLVLGWQVPSSADRKSVV